MLNSRALRVGVNTLENTIYTAPCTSLAIYHHDARSGLSHCHYQIWISFTRILFKFEVSEVWKSGWKSFYM